MIASSHTYSKQSSSFSLSHQNLVFSPIRATDTAYLILHAGFTIVILGAENPVLFSPQFQTSPQHPVLDNPHSVSSVLDSGCRLVPLSSQSKHTIINYGLVLEIRLGYSSSHDSVSSKESLGSQDVPSSPVMYIHPLSSHVRFPLSNHFTNLKHNVEVYLQFQNSEFCLHLVVMGSYDSRNKQRLRHQTQVNYWPL